MADVPVQASVCGTVPNFIGHGLGGMETGNRNASRKTEALQGIWMTSENVPESLELWGTMALVTSSQETATYRTAWREEQGWGEGMLDSWDDQGTDGHLHEREGGKAIRSVRCASLLALGQANHAR